MPSDFVAYVLDQLHALGRVRSKPMFGGYGIDHRDVIVAIVVKDTLYLKTDAQTRPRYDAEGLRPFTCSMPNGKPYEMSERVSEKGGEWRGRHGETIRRNPSQTPSSCEAPTVDDASTLCEWTREAFEASSREAACKPKRKKK